MRVSPWPSVVRDPSPALTASTSPSPAWWRHLSSAVGYSDTTAGQLDPWWRHLLSAVGYSDITAGQSDDVTYHQLFAILTSQLASLMTSLIVSCRLFWNHSWPVWRRHLLSAVRYSDITAGQLDPWWRHLSSAVGYFDITTGQFDDITYCQLSAILT